MSDSGRQVGDCRHGRTEEYCPDCTRASLVHYRRVVSLAQESIQSLIADAERDETIRALEQIKTILNLAR